MNRDQAQQVGNDILSSAPPGDDAFFASEGMAQNNPHYSAANGLHSDGWHAVKQPDGSVSVDKFHNPA